MKKEIIINSALNEMRIAITEDDRLAELFIESPDNERVVGNIYYGKVSKVIQGINAAFINIGSRHDAFLHFSDVDDSLENLYTDDDDEEEEKPAQKKKQNSSSNEKAEAEVVETEDDIEKQAETTVIAKNKSNAGDQKSHATNAKLPHFRTKRAGEIGIKLEPGQNVVVQIVREAYSTKGVRVTTRIGMPGRYVVLLPYDNIIGISKKINIPAERRRLRSLARTYLPKGVGCIIRTASAGKNEEELIKDYQSLLDKWQIIQKKIENAQRPGLVYQDVELATSVIRDLFTADVSRVAVDSKKLYKDITSYLRVQAPKLVTRVEYFNGVGHIFNYFGIEKELENTYQRKVLLASGGSIVIDQTEAMFIIDINSGRSIQNEQEQNALKTDLEAVVEIARQIRLRDMSGMILIDFIDVMSEANKRKIVMEMKKELRRDRAKTVVYPLTQLCIMQITRQRVNQYITDKITETCPMCDGRGKIASKAVLVNSIEAWLRGFRAKSKEFKLRLVVHPTIANYLMEGTISRIQRLMIKYFVKIKVRQSDQIHIDEFKIYSEKTEQDITQDYIYKI